jgi:hypothetical protein
MAVRKMTKTQSRARQTPRLEGVVASISLNGEALNNESSLRTGACAKNGASPSFEQIQCRAYELFVARGGTHGCDLADWLMAEQELTATSAVGH